MQIVALASAAELTAVAPTECMATLESAYDYPNSSDEYSNACGAVLKPFVYLRLFANALHRVDGRHYAVDCLVAPRKLMLIL